MDDSIAGLVIVLIFLSPVLLIPCCIPCWIATSKTRSWAKEKRRLHERRYGPLPQKENNDPEAALSDSESEESESDYLDSEDERYAATKREEKAKAREEKEADMALSVKAKFWKEYKLGFKGTSPEKVKLEAEAKAEAERKKIAREAVREYVREERRKVRKARKAAEQEVELPAYGKVVEGGKA
jgi:hypothetical protein